MSKNDNVNLRLLDNKEFEREDFKKIMEEYGYEGLDPYTCKVLIGEEKDTNRIVSILVCRPRFHAEPLWVHPDYKDSLLCTKMYRGLLKLYENFKGLHLYIFSHRRAINVASKRVGFKEEPYTVLVKEIV